MDYTAEITACIALAGVIALACLFATAQGKEAPAPPEVRGNSLAGTATVIVKNISLRDVVYLWPEVLETGVVPSDYSREQAVADALSGWGNVMAGQTPPKNFGKGMALLGATYGFTPTTDGTLAESQRLLCP